MTPNHHQRKLKKKSKTKHQTVPVLPSAFPYFETNSADSFSKTGIPSEVTDETVGNNFRLLPSSDFCNFYKHDPE